MNNTPETPEITDALQEARKPGSLDLSQYLNDRKPIITKNVMILGMLFTTLLIASNMTAFKVVEIPLPFLSIHFPAGLVFFPLTYFFDDALTEVYGFKVSRLIIWTGLICTIIFTAGVWATTYLPTSPAWREGVPGGDEAYSLVLSGSFRVVTASTIAYFCGEFFNSAVLAKLKILTAGRYLFVRIIGSTLVGVGFDTLIFCHIAFWGTLQHSMIWEIILTEYVCKVGYEVIMLPVTYKLTNYLKNLDRIDYYDFDTKFNPFSLSLSE